MSLTRTINPIARVSTAKDAGRAIVIIVGPGELIGFRRLGTRHVFETTASACYALAVKAEVAAKAANRKVRRA
jgi:hypothetical protein